MLPMGLQAALRIWGRLNSFRRRRNMARVHNDKIGGMMRKSLLALILSAASLLAQEGPRVFTIQDLFPRNVGSTEQQNKQVPPPQIIGNIYYVGTESLSS